MIRRVWLAAAMISIGAGFAIAASQKSVVDGRWQGSLMTADGPATVTYNFEVKGQVLTGTGETRAGSQTITDGKVNGDKISFKTSINGNSIEHQGTVSDDTIQLKNFGPGGEFDLTLKRVSSEKKASQ